MKNRILLFIISLILSSLLFGSNVLAQDKMGFTITPPLIKNNVNPGQVWASAIKVVNNTDKPEKVYTDLVNFESGNETGTVRLAPLTQEEIEGNEYLINNWIVIEEGPFEIPPFGSVEIPFIVDVPDNANPGDHHIALLIGTRPPDKKNEGSSMKVASMVGSLLLLNVTGDLNESGIIREFTTDRSWYDSGYVNFTLRFQNTGNSILQPQGEIRVYNFSEKDQGSVTINHKTNSGNVFPGDTRKWEFSWPVPDNLFKMGRYRAELILAHGVKARETNDMSVYFWVIQLKPVLITVISFLLFVTIIVLLVRRYIKKAILRTQEQLGLVNGPVATQQVKIQKAQTKKPAQKVLNLKEEGNGLKNKTTKKKKSGSFAPWKIILPIVLFLVVAVAGALAFYYYKNTTNISIPVIPVSEEGDIEQIEFIEIEDKDEDAQVEIGQEEQANEEIASGTEETLESGEEVLNKEAAIRIQNGSGKSGVAALADEIISENGFQVQRTGNADNFDYEISELKYRGDFSDSAKFLTEKLGLDVEPELDETIDFDISIILGADFEAQEVEMEE